MPSDIPAAAGPTPLVRRFRWVDVTESPDSVRRRVLDAVQLHPRSA